jgi:hypothetical protein
MLYPTVTELVRGTAHPETRRFQTVLVARSPWPDLVAGSPGLDRNDQESGAVQRIRDASRPAAWRGQRAA